jgi:arylsulfatase A-like enzyme
MLSSYGNILFISVDCCRGDRLPVVAPWPHQRHPPPAEGFDLDDQLRKGVLFSRVVAGLPYSAGSYCTLFSGFNGNIHGCNAYRRMPTSDIHGQAYGAASYRSHFHPEIVTLTELIRERGYRTLHYSTCMPERLGMFVPNRGFDVYEHEPLEEVPAAYNAEDGPRFLFLKFDELHELSAALHVAPDPTTQTGRRALRTSEYDDCLMQSSELLQKMMSRVEIGENDVVLWMTDHGKILDEPYGLSGEVEHGWGMKDDSVLMWLSIQHKDLPSDRKVDSMVREIDILPTLSSMLGLRRLSAQGEDVSGLALEPREQDHDRVACIETANYGGIYPSDRHPNRWGLRTEPWKFTRHAILGNQLFDLEENPDEQDNLAYRQKGVRLVDGKREFYDVLRHRKHPMEEVLERKLDEFRLEARSPRDFYLGREASALRRLASRLAFAWMLRRYRLSQKAPVVFLKRAARFARRAPARLLGLFKRPAKGVI